MTVLTQTKVINPNKLPFLQAQILQHIYLTLADKNKTSIKDLSELTDYSKDSKILADAIKMLVDKGFVEGDLLNGFSIPENCFDLFLRIVKRNDYKRKEYSEKIIKFAESKDAAPSTLFEFEQTISDLNKFGVIHTWYDYLEDFPYSLIEEKIIEYKLKPESLIVEPFAGSGTTLISANLFKCNAVGFDANPLMTFISEVKTTWDIDLAQYKNEISNISKKFVKGIHNFDKLQLDLGFINVMPKKEINQWLSPALQKEVILLKNLVDEIKNKKIKNLLLIALSKSCFDASYVSLCPGTTFYPFREKEDFWDLFTKKVIQIYNDLKSVQKHNHYGKSELITDSCLNAKKHLKPNSIDFIVTSPPYPNDLEYTRQTRLELYLLDFVKSMDDVQQIKRKMVKGSTKLIFKESNSETYAMKFEEVKIVSNKIYEQTKDKNWGFDYPRMVREYFGDMYLCMQEFYDLMKNDANFLQVVGDQTIKGVYIPVCDILIKMAQEIGYRNCRKELFRLRRSTGHNILLPEEIVIIQK
jgi:DNA modification methylase